MQSAKRLRNIRGLFLFFTDIVTGLPLPVHAALSAVCEVGRMNVPGKPILFGTTEEFLRRFGIQSLDDLPSMNPEQIENFKTEAEEEAQLKLDI